MIELQLSTLTGVAAGLVMGLIISSVGAGGSLFIVPVMLFLFDEPLASATGSSLAVVFAASLVGAIGHARRGNWRPRVALLFGGAAMLGSVGGAALHPLVTERVGFGLFGVALVVAAIRMAAGTAPPAGQEQEHPARLLPLGLALGVLTGFLGVGGGFLIVPALIWGARLQVRDAIGTSLAIIALSSATGAATHALQGHVTPALILSVGGGAAVGALGGAPLSGKLPEKPIRYAFAALAALLSLKLFAQALFPST